MTSWTIACQAPLSMEFSRQEYWSGLSFSSLEDLSDLGNELRSPALQADSLPFKPPGKALQTSLYLEKYASYPLQLRSPCVLLTPVPPSFFCNLLHQLPLFLSPVSLSLQICSRAPCLKENNTGKGFSTPTSHATCSLLVPCR